MRFASAVLALWLAAAWPAGAVTKIVVTVIDDKTALPVTDLIAQEFRVLDDKTPRTVEAAEFSQGGLLDVMLLLDSSLLGEAVQSLAASLIRQLDPKDQMALVAFHSSADLIQDFTSSQEALLRALSGVKFGNVPQVLDALFAALDGGFQNTSFRRVILLATAGVEGPSRVSERRVLQLARRNSVAIYPIYIAGTETFLFRSLAEQTGAASFHLPSLRKKIPGDPSPQIFEVVRGRYTLTLAGNLALGEKIKVELTRKGKFRTGVLPLD